MVSFAIYASVSANASNFNGCYFVVCLAGAASRKMGEIVWKISELCAISETDVICAMHSPTQTTTTKTHSHWVSAWLKQETIVPNAIKMILQTWDARRFFCFPLDSVV